MPAGGMLSPETNISPFLRHPAAGRYTRSSAGEIVARRHDFPLLTLTLFATTLLSPLYCPHQVHIKGEEPSCLFSTISSDSFYSFGFRRVVHNNNYYYYHNFHNNSAVPTKYILKARSLRVYFLLLVRRDGRRRVTRTTRIAATATATGSPAEVYVGQH